jgi:hypothetical protein
MLISPKVNADFKGDKKTINFPWFGAIPYRYNLRKIRASAGLVATG